MKYRIILIMTLIFFSGSLLAQEEVIHGDNNLWFLLINRVNLSSKWSVTNELHQRNNNYFADQAQFLERPSIDYHVNPNFEASVGYTFLRTRPVYPSTIDFYRNENNMWEQLLFKFDVGKFHLQNRLRQENRWVNHVIYDTDHYAVDGNDYANRFRYRMTASVDLVKLKNDHRLTLNAFDEIWINQDMNLRPTNFARNWLFLGLGYKWNKDFQVQAGYMSQYDRIGLDRYVSTPIMQLVVVKNFSYNKKNGE